MSEPIKVLGIPAQIDFGNFAVGIGTLIVAAVTAWSVWSSNKSKSNEIKKNGDIQIALLRMKWNSDLRSFIARYLAIHRQISLIKLKSKTGKTSVGDRPLLIELYEIRSSILMMIKENSQIEAEKQLEKLISLDHPDISDDARKIRQDITIAARNVLKGVWAQAKTEIRS